MQAPVNLTLLIGFVAAMASSCDARADWLPDAVELPLYTRHFQHNDRFNNSTPGLVLQWDTPLAFAGTNAVRAHLGAFKNSNGDPTIYTRACTLNGALLGRCMPGLGLG